jgi:DNA polymerase-3 subunit gamma/tau
MSYQVLARRYRPQTFADVIGQEHVTRVLSGAVAAGRVAHGYLFTGPRGVGKTSTARILAKALNCAKGPAEAPCNACNTCQEITAGRSLDVLEIDGASSGGIDQVRELRENARYAPSGGRFKLYIIDEVHQVTAHGFNALLKTLEEPPPHVVFVLATTEVQKVPDTIISRVQRFDFRRLTIRDIEDQLQKIVAEEKFRLDVGALRVLSQRAQGSLRDAEVLLDQVVAAAAGDVNRETVERLLGLTGADTYLALTERLAAHDPQGALTLFDRVLAQGANLGELATGLVEHLRHLMLLAVSRDMAPMLGLTDDLIERYEAQLESWTKGDVARLLAMALGAAREMRRSELPRVHMELALVEMAELGSTADLRTLVARLDALGGGSGGASVGGGSRSGSEARAGSRPGTLPGTIPAGGPARRGNSGPEGVRVAPGVTAVLATPSAPAVAAPIEAHQPEPGPAAGEPELHESEAPLEVLGVAADFGARGGATSAAGGGDPRWLKVIERVRMRKTSLASLLAEAREIEVASGVIEIAFPEGQSFYRGKVLEPRNLTIITEEVRAEFGPGVRIEIARGDKPAAPAPRPGSGPPPARSQPARFSAGVEEIVERFDGIILD